jgi:hypothetical protein
VLVWNRSRNKAQGLSPWWSHSPADAGDLPGAAWSPACLRGAADRGSSEVQADVDARAQRLLLLWTRRPTQHGHLTGRRSKGGGGVCQGTSSTHTAARLPRSGSRIAMVKPSPAPTPAANYVNPMSKDTDHPQGCLR